MTANVDNSRRANRHQRSPWLFTERRLTLLALAVALGTAAEFAASLAIWLSGGRTPFHNENCIDFTWIWLAAKFSASAAPVHAYDYSAFVAAKLAQVGPPDCILEHFDYPPTLFFYIYPLSALPYPAAFTAWLAVTVIVYLAAVYAIIPHRTALIAALAPGPVWTNILLGHDGFLTAGFMGFALAFAETRPRLAAIPLALLTYKPQFGVLVPLALAASRRWGTLALAAMASLAFAALAAAVFGHETWLAFAQALVDRTSALTGDPQSVRPLSSLPFLLSIGANSQVVWLLQLIISVGAAVAVCVLWAGHHPYNIKAAALAFGSLVFSPHVFNYDFCIVTIGALFLVKDGLIRGFLRGERTLLLAGFLTLYFPFGPISLFGCIALLGLTVRRALWLRAHDPEPPHTGGLKEAHA